MEKGWYVVHTYSGYEQKVKEDLDKRLKSLQMEHIVEQVLIPTEEVVEVKKGKKEISNKKFFPGYILIKMEMTDETWHIIKSVPRVTGFVGPPRAPSMVSEEEVSRLLKQIEKGAEKPKPKFAFERGEGVKIIDGPFASFMGQVEEVNFERNKLKVMVSIFGRATPVELNFIQVEKV
ncbi:MAG: transcription termination/antitermination protein NusG [bacterium]